ncbi:MAG: MFS transporter [Oscillospiraceae bacterium]|nr:MFS transporter [Oscillospiraceae bacterium]
MKEDTRHIHYAYVILVSVMIQRLVVSAENSVIGLFILPVTEALHVSQGQFMLYTTIQYLMLAASSVAVRKLMGKVRYVVLNRVGLLFMTGGILCMAAAKSIWMFYIGGALNGIGLCVTIFLLTGTLIPRWFSGNTGLMIATASLGSTISATAAYPIVSRLLMRETVLGLEAWRGTYVILALLPGSIGLVNSVLLMRESPESMGLEKLERAGRDKATEQRWEHLSVSGDTALKSRSYKTLVTAVILWNVSITACSYMAAYTSTTEAYATAAFDLRGLLGVASTIGTFIGGYILGGLNDRLGAGKGLILAGICGAAGYLMFFMGRKAPFMILAGSFILGIFISLNNVQLPAMVETMYGTKDYDRIFPAASSASSWIGAITSSVWGFINDFTGGYTVLLISAAAIAAMSLLTGLAAVREAGTLERSI